MERKVCSTLLDVNRNRSGRQHLDGIAGFQIGLALFGVCRLTGELPDRHRGVAEGVVERFADLMRESRYVLEASLEDARGYPTRVRRDPARLGHGLVGEESVESQNATGARCIGVARIERKQKRIRPQL